MLDFEIEALCDIIHVLKGSYYDTHLTDEDHKSQTDEGTCLQAHKE